MAGPAVSSRFVAAVTVTSRSAIRLADQLLQRLAVPLAERRPLALAVVREDDELIGPRGLLGCGLQHADEVVQPGERGQRLRPGRAGVVGDLVVVGEVAVDARVSRPSSARR